MNTSGSNFNHRSLLALLQLSSPSLPIGAFAYSQGLEAAVEAELVKDQASLEQWLDTTLSYGLSQLDLPLLLRLYAAWQQHDLSEVQHWQHQLLANRETAELVQEEQQLGKTFYRLLQSLELAPVNIPDQALYLSMYAYAAQKMQIPVEHALIGWLWSWLENQVVVACKTIPLGQTPAQQILLKLQPQLEAALNTALQVNDQHIGLTLPSLVMVSAWHEHQYSRLFRS